MQAQAHAHACSIARLRRADRLLLVLPHPRQAPKVGPAQTGPTAPTGPSPTALLLVSLLQVGPCYGRRMLKGYMLPKGVAISERHIRLAIPQVAPIQHRQRQLGQVNRTNPHLYHANYYGEIDQNEKLCMYGVTYVLARDGYSGRITAGAVMSQKNNITIYDEVYLPTVVEDGLWDQVSVDYGREFYLVWYIQEKLRAQRGNF